VQDDDEKRFPRISLWQFLTGLFRWSRDADKFFDGRWVADLASADQPDEPTKAPRKDKTQSGKD
jgi:hypothetical protein